MSYVNNVRMFVRVFELENMSAAARDQRVSPAVASNRISELEKHLGVRLFNRTTRRLQPTEHGRIFYNGANRILETIADAETSIADAANHPRGSIFVSAPLGVGRRFIAPAAPEFQLQYPDVSVRLRLSDRKVDLAAEGLDISFTLGALEDSNLRVRMIEECPRTLVASPEYVAAKGMPTDGASLITDDHACLMLRFPGVIEFQWMLQTPDGPQPFAVSGPFETDDGDVLIDWALAGAGIINKPVFEVAEYLADGRLVEVAMATPPVPATLACLYPHRRLQDPKIRLFVDFMAAECKTALAKRRALFQLPR